MNKNIPVVTAMLGAAALIIQQYVGVPGGADLKVVGLAVLIAVLGILSSYLKGKGASFWGIFGTVIYTLVEVYKSGNFNWNEAILTATLAAIMVFAPTAVPERNGDDAKK